MRISINWLKEFVDIDVTPEDLAEQLTMLGLEIESIQRPGSEISGVVVGEILSIEPHPDADKLVVCRTRVDDTEPLQIVCGARNMSVGDKVPTAVIGATLAGGFKIKRRAMRGVESFGMMCAADELGLGDDHAGLLILDPDTPVGIDAKPILGLDDVIMDIEVTPNRGDWAGMIGVARELAALYRVPVRMPDPKLIEHAARAAADLSSVTIEDPDLCPRYLGRIITGVKVGPSPAWLCRRLLAAGQRPINNIVDITNYVLLETGHPLHAFDYERLTENRIVVRRAKQGETLETLDEQTRRLTTDMLVIADAQSPVALAGVMGGANSEVGESTSTIFLESAYFNPISIRRTARALAMNTEASQRFQRGADPEMAAFAVDRAAALIAQLGQGTVAAGRIDAYPQPLEPRRFTLRYARTNRLIGQDVSPATQREILDALHFSPEPDGEAACRVTVPTWRHDVSQEADLIEEIARMVGYQNIQPSLPKVRPTEARLAPHETALAHLRNFLCGCGLTELMSMTFTSPAEVERAGLAEPYTDMVALQNPISENYATMRRSLLPGFLSTVSLNLRRGTRDILAFEVGPVYIPRPTEELPEQRTHLGIVLTGSRAPAHWGAAPQPIDIFDIKGYAESAVDYLGAPVQVAPRDFPHLAPGHAAALELDGVTLGSFGEASQTALQACDIAQPVFLLEIDISNLLLIKKLPPQFQQPPTLPPSLRDIAVLVDADVPAGALAQTAQEAGGKLLSRVDVFDVYTGKQVPAGKKSVALSLVFQAPDRTLTDQETQKTWDRILQSLQAKHKAELR